MNPPKNLSVFGVTLGTALQVSCPLLSLLCSFQDKGRTPQDSFYNKSNVKSVMLRKLLCYENTFLTVAKKILLKRDLVQTGLKHRPNANAVLTGLHNENFHAWWKIPLPSIPFIGVFFLKFNFSSWQPKTKLLALVVHFALVSKLNSRWWEDYNKLCIECCLITLWRVFLCHVACCRV